VAEGALPSGVTCIRDTCNVYLLRAGSEALAIDFGTGTALDLLAGLGIERITDVLLTHHHRDQAQGLARAVAAGARVWAPPFDAPLPSEASVFWQTRQLDVDYDLREDRFTPLDSVEIAGTVDEYRARRYGAFDVYALPTPGHTPGSVTYIVEIEGRAVAFSGDLVYGDGQTWSLAATQWTYSGIEGLEAGIISARELAKRRPSVLLPSHGEPVLEAEQALATLAGRLGALAALRTEGEWGLESRLAEPFDRVTPSLWRNRTTFANSYVLRSSAEPDAWLGFDFGYDMATGRRPLLWSLEDVRLEAVIVSHYHDDHVAGLNLLRAATGAEVWAPANVAPVLEEPHRYDLPCLWPEPIRVDRVLPFGEPFQWHEHELTVHPLPGHTLYAGAIELVADGRRVLVTGDQWAFGGERGILNYQYRNRFARRDFVSTSRLLRELEPDILLSGHWLPRAVDAELLDQLERDAVRLAELHDALLPAESFGDGGFGARIEPYRCSTGAGEELPLEVTVRNPFARAAEVVASLVIPAGWSAAPATAEVAVAAHGEAELRFVVRAGSEPVRRARVAVELTVDGVAFGQQAEALVDVA